MHALDEIVDRLDVGESLDGMLEIQVAQSFNHFQRFGELATVEESAEQRLEPRQDRLGIVRLLA